MNGFPRRPTQLLGMRNAHRQEGIKSLQLVGLLVKKCVRKGRQCQEAAPRAAPVSEAPVWIKKCTCLIPLKLSTLGIDDTRTKGQANIDTEQNLAVCVMPGYIRSDQVTDFGC